MTDANNARSRMAPEQLELLHGRGRREGASPSVAFDVDFVSCQ